MARVIPEGFWGDDHNKRIVMYWVDRFVDLRRFESLTLHQVTQKIQVYLHLFHEAILAERITDYNHGLASVT
jgi:telomerase reverse transcriptase